MAFRKLLSKPGVAEVTPVYTRAKQKAGALIVDVRELSEWHEGHIPGAIHILLSTLARRSPELEPSQEIIAVCRSVHRSVSAVRILQQQGFSDVSTMASGMISWVKQGFPVQR